MFKRHQNEEEFVESEEYLESDGEYYEDEYYGDDEYIESEEYAESGEYAEAEEYAASGEYVEAEEYAESVEYAEAEEYAESVEYAEAEEYAESGEYVEAEEYAESEEYAEAEEDAASGEYIEYEDYDEEYYEEYAGEDDENRGGFFAWFAEMAAMDKVMMAAGVFILLLAIVTGVVFLQKKTAGDYTSEFASVGAQLDGIEVVGEEGLLAVADAKIAKLEALKLLEEEKKGDYEEADYNKSVTVILKTVSVQKDLKIKFVNKSSDKLIPNVPFSVTVTTPDKKTETWSDDDMDGIIYKKGITPGNYTVAVNELAGEKYKNYTIPSGNQKVEVKKDIAYQKIDVSDEVKTESEIDLSKEEQKKQEPDVESSLEDTVEWVASTAVTNTYVEVGKSSITDPMTLVMSGAFLRTAKEVKLNETDAELKSGETLQLKASHSLENVISTGWRSSDPSVATVDVDGLVTAVAGGTATITCTVTVSEETSEGNKEVAYKATCEVQVEKEDLAEGSITVKPTSMSLIAGTTEKAQASVSGYKSDQKLIYSVGSSDVGVATAEVDQNGKITVTAVSSGNATITVSANYSEDPLEEAPSATIAVEVLEVDVFTLDKTEATVYIGSPVTIRAVLTGDVEATVEAKSSDKSVATVAVDGKQITITGVKAGTAKITVTVTANGNSNFETCVVTVKKNPKEDKSTSLKDNAGNQLYVQENESYREAVYADYYVDGIKFFKKGETKYTGWQTLDGKVYFFDKNGKKVTGEQVIQGARYTFASDGSLVTGSGTMGIDVSKHNASIDWKAVKNSGVSYVIIRCGYRGYTQGSLVIDPMFEQNIKGATAAGLKVGVYFFSQAVDEVEAVQEASFVLDAVKGYKISYPIFLDVEYSGAAGNKGRADGLDKATRTAVCKAFCATIQSSGYTAGIYANKSWLETKLDPGQLGSYKIWLAQYAATPTYAGKYDMWQYKSTGKVSGITGNVDMNISYLGY